MKTVEYLTGANVSPLPRRDLVAILAYLNRSGTAVKCVDGTFACHDAQLDRLAAAARMQ
jgi:hypothetical protein